MAIDWEYYKKKAKKIDEENYRKNISNDIAPVRTQTPTPSTAEDSKWFQKSALLNDGWDKGDVSKTVKASGTDVAENAGAGFMGAGEKILDFLAFLGTAMNGQQMQTAAQNEMMFNAITGKDIDGKDTLEKYRSWQKEAEKGTEEFIKKDLYDEQAIAKKIITAPLEQKWGINVETDSVFGQKADELAQSAGQLGATAIASMFGAGSAMIGATAFGGEMESALNQGATYNEAAFSSMVSAGAEILTEKISGGIKFGGKTLDETLTKRLTSSISNNVARKLVSLGMDAAGEGFEEVLSGTMSAIGQKLSYASDKELNELFSSEDAWNSFVGGAILGGLSSGGKNVKAKIKGVDSITGLTKNEQAVFDKVYNDRINEAKNGNKKLSSKDKSNIFNSVMNDLERGRIGIDTIESVLGGETYKQYQSAVEKDNQMKELQKEYDSLYRMKNGEKSDEQIDRQKALKEQLEEYKNTSKLSDIQKQLSNEVSELAKSSKLVESYNEKSRRSQAFEADLTQYDAKAQETVKRAIDSGILNNTNRTHEFVDLLAKLEADKGVLFDFTNNEKIKETGFAIEGKQVNGYVQGNNIAINIDSTSALNKVVGHEITHVLEGTELYTELANAVKQLATTKGEYDSKLQSITKLYEGVEDANIENELTAELIGEYLFTDTDFINSLSAEKPTLFKKIFDEIKYLCKIATPGSKEAKQLEKVKKTFAEAYKQKNNTATNDGVIKYSFNDSKTGMANDKLIPYDEELTSIIEQKGGYVIDSFEKLENVVNLAFDNPQQKATAYFGILSPDVLSNIENNIPNLPKELNGNLFKQGRDYSIAATLDSIRHIIDEKDLSRTDVVDYLDRLSDTIVDYDTVHFNYYIDNRGQRANGVIFKKKFNDGTIESFELVSNGQKSLKLQTIYMERADYKKRKSAKTPLIQNVPAHTPEAWVSRTSNNIISKPTENVKEVFGYKINQDATVDEDLLEDMSYYHPDAEVDTQGNITVYHRTSKANADKIKQTGVMTAKEDALFFSSKESGYASDYGDTVVKMKIPSTELRLNDVFDGEVHFDLPLKYKNGGYSLNVSKYLVDDTKMSLSVANDIGPVRERNNVYGEDIKLQTASSDDIAPIGENVVLKKNNTDTDTLENIGPTREDVQPQKKSTIDVPDLFVKPVKSENTQHILDEKNAIETIIENMSQQMFPFGKYKNVYGYAVKQNKYRKKDGSTDIRVTIITPDGKKMTVIRGDSILPLNVKVAKIIIQDHIDNGNMTNEYGLPSIAINQDLGPVREDIKSSETTETVEEKPKSKRLERAIRKIDTQFEQDKADLNEDFQQKKAELEKALENKTTYISDKSLSLYKELQNLRKGVRASNDLAYFLDLGYQWKDLKSTLLKVHKWPDTVLNTESEIESTVREAIGRDFDEKSYELDDLDTEYQKQLENLEKKAEEKRKKAGIAEQRRVKVQEYRTQMDDLIGDTTTWKDKKLGVQYQINTLRRNLRDIVRDKSGKRDLAKADAIYDELQGRYNHNEAELNREANRIKKVYADMQINKVEDKYIQMLGEYRHNPDTKLTLEEMQEFLEKNRDKIDEAKVDRVIELARETYDSLFGRVNAVLKEQGMREIPYRLGYFPHFTEEKQGRLAKLLNWKTQKTDIPTDIAGLTEQFNPNRSWQSFNKQRTGDDTDYSFTKGLDTYVQGALDWIYHIEDIQKRRAFENHIRYVHSEKGIQEKIDAIHNSDEYDADEMQEQIDAVFKEAGNPLNNFVTDFRTQTNTLAGKKSSMDRNMEAMLSRDIYSTMTNISNRVTANMVVGSVSSALTNFIPITQSWGEVSPISSIKAMKDTIKSAVRDDGIIDKSDFLTNRLKKSENLYQTTWDKVIDKAGAMMEIIDSFTSQTVWRSKYLENISNGMSENESVKNADQFAENVLAGRSRGNNPTIFDSKNPLIKTLTAFQLEVNNQYGYMFKDMPQDLKNKSIGKLVKGYGTMFLGAYAYNALYSALTGRDAAFDPLSIIDDLLKDLFGDDEEEPADIIMNFTDNVLEEVPFVGGLIGGGRIPISSALPYDDGIYGAFEGIVTDVTEGNWGNLAKEVGESFVSYLLLPAGGGQIKKSIQGLQMFDDDFPIAGSYTDSGKLRFSVEETPGNIAQATLFGQYASKTARQYFDEEHAPLSDKQTKELVDIQASIEEYWEYQKGLKKLGEDATLAEKIDYIADLEEFDTWQKNIMANNLTDRKTPIDLTGYEAIGDFEEFDYSMKNPEKYAISKAVGGYDNYIKYSEHLGNITAEKDKNGNSVSGSRKKKVARYINNLDIEFGEKMILYRSQYKSDDTYNAQIVEYLNDRNDITHQDKITILTELGFKVLSDGTVKW